MSPHTQSLLSSEQLPLFFFSYARIDWDPYLDRFLHDLKLEVARELGATDPNTVAFVDTDSVETGEDWNTRIGAAAQRVGVLVSIYSKSYFSVRRTHEYCAKEFYAFLKRAPALRVEKILDGDKTLYRVRDAKNIVPVLWYSESDLLPDNLPPYVIRTIVYSLNALDSAAKSTYKEKGLRRIATKRAGTYFNIVRALARLIEDDSMEPLPAMPNRPEFASLLNVFWDPLGEVGEPRFTGGEDRTGFNPGLSSISDRRDPSGDSIVAELGPRQLLLVALRAQKTELQEWIPFGGRCSMAALVEEAAIGRHFVISVKNMAVEQPDLLFSSIQQLLFEAQASNTVVVILVDPECLVTFEPVFRSLVAQDNWSGGVMIPGHSAQTNLHSGFRQSESEFLVSVAQLERIAIRTGVQTPEEFRISFTSLLDDVVGKIVRYGPVMRSSPDNEGLGRKPLIANVSIKAES